MTALGTEILQDILSTTRATDAFAMVAIGGADDATANPRACIHLESHETFRCDDSPAVTWIRMNLRIRIHARHSSADQGIARVMDLCSILSDRLLDDPYRGGRCCDLPVGQATELIRCEVNRTVRRPEIEAVLHARCHFESEGGF